MYIYILEDQNIEGKRDTSRLQRIDAPCSNKDTRTNIDGTPMIQEFQKGPRRKKEELNITKDALRETGIK